MRGLQYWDGHLDGTFTVTNIPEPSSALLLGMVALLFTRRRRG
ncbi:MAG: PEP-CTERM sorting domain-containing protein [Akkermansiaceae bacterium]